MRHRSIRKPVKDGGYALRQCSKKGRLEDFRDTLKIKEGMQKLVEPCARVFHVFHSRGFLYIWMEQACAAVEVANRPAETGAGRRRGERRRGRRRSRGTQALLNSTGFLQSGFENLFRREAIWYSREALWRCTTCRGRRCALSTTLRNRLLNPKNPWLSWFCSSRAPGLPRRIPRTLSRLPNSTR